MILLSGKELRDKIKDEIRHHVFSNGIFPELAIVQVGDNPESNIYIKQKQNFGDDVGIIVQHMKLSEDITEDDLIEKIKSLNDKKEVNGIIVQLPLPKGLDRKRILDSISPEKDVDGLGSFQQNLLEKNAEEKLLPATPKGIMSLLDFYNLELKDKKVAVIGCSDLVGKPVSALCKNAGALVSVCDKDTKDIKEVCLSSDFIIVACGVPKLVDKNFLKNGSVVIDVGIHRTNSGICGDVDFDSVKSIVSAITPVPGGVGPVTVASLFQNVILAYDYQHKG